MSGDEADLVADVEQLRSDVRASMAVRDKRWGSAPHLLEALVAAEQRLREAIARRILAEPLTSPAQGV